VQALPSAGWGFISIPDIKATPPPLTPPRRREGNLGGAPRPQAALSAAMALILNILWFIFGGFISGLAWLLAGVLLAITIVGLPWSAAAFRIAGFSFAPFGRHVVSRGTGPIGFLGNVIWVVIAGWWLALHHVVLGLALMVTIIGIPFGLQHLKLALISFAPIGQEVVEG
jgi:uncharacterized membrane protein YccF (DUF307 family)